MFEVFYDNSLRETSKSAFWVDCCVSRDPTWSRPSSIFKNLLSFQTENHGLWLGGDNYHPCCFPLSCKSHQCELEVITRESQQNYIVSTMQRRDHETSGPDQPSAVEWRQEDSAGASAAADTPYAQKNPSGYPGGHDRMPSLSSQNTVCLVKLQCKVKYLWEEDENVIVPFKSDVGLMHGLWCRCSWEGRGQTLQYHFLKRGTTSRVCQPKGAQYFRPRWEAKPKCTKWLLANHLVTKWMRARRWTWYQM